MPTAVEIARASSRFHAEAALAVRRAAGIPRRLIAVELGVTELTVSRWEHGQSKPHGPMLVRYVDLLEKLKESA